ncbi:MAG: hypothetical protein LQ340_000263 [Diploschistes diacapsis]|nr:MAG: hypothetical protein LQ340_000263 [Diploschistes diacapsis]
MATSTAPSTPAHHPSIQRSFTLPPKLSRSPKSPVTPKSPEGAGVETLFIHHRGKIVSFTTSLGGERSRSASVASTTRQNEPVGALPWRSQTERTVAAGLIRIYKVPNSVTFLNYGNLKTVHPILPKSQCWCVDGETIFVLRIRSNNYYRIELPNESPEDKVIAEEFESVLDRIAQYEKTACPFQRGFSVELPERPQTPKRPWKPKHLPSSPTPFSPDGKTATDPDVERSNSPNQALAEPEYKGENVLATRISSTHEEVLPEPTTSYRSTTDKEPEKVGQLVATFEDLRSNKIIDDDVQPVDVASREDFLSKPAESRMPDMQESSVATLLSQAEETAKKPADEEREVTLAQPGRTTEPFDQQTKTHSSDETKASSPDLSSTTSPSTLHKQEKEQFIWLDDFADTITPTDPQLPTSLRSITAPLILNQNRRPTDHTTKNSLDDPETCGLVGLFPVLPQPDIASPTLTTRFSKPISAL